MSIINLFNLANTILVFKFIQLEFYSFEQSLSILICINFVLPNSGITSTVLSVIFLCA
jgi:hypothetical protein